MTPGEMIIADGDIELNAGRATITLSVTNSGDRPVQAAPSAPPETSRERPE